jgi:CHAD domain-containing protein
MAAISTSTFAVEQVGKRFKDLAARVTRVRKEADLEAVHALRVSIRRLQPVLDVFQPCFPAKRVKKIRKRLREALVRAGEVRDCDSALKILSKLRTRGIAGLRVKLQEKREQAASGLQGQLETEWNTELALAQDQRKFCLQPAQSTARRELVRLAKDFFESGDRATASSGTSARQLHQVRIAAKQLHYSLELFAPLTGRPARMMLSKIREVQRLLGAVNDQRSTRDILSGLGGSPSLEEQLKKKQRKRTKRFRQTWKEHFPRDLVKQWIQALGSRPVELRRVAPVLDLPK